MKNLSRTATLMVGIFIGIMLASLLLRDADALIRKNELKKGYPVGAGTWLITQVRLAIIELNALNPSEKVQFKLITTDDGVKFDTTVLYLRGKSVTKLKREARTQKFQAHVDELTMKITEAVNVYARGAIQNFDPKEDLVITFKANSKSGFVTLGRYSSGQLTLLEQ